MYRRIDGVAMGSPLGPALANIFVGYYDSRLFNKILKPTVYYRYIDDTFSLFHKETDFQKFLNCLNSFALGIFLVPNKTKVFFKFVN